MEFKNQISATVCGNLAILSYCIAVGWSSPNESRLRSENSPLSSGSLSIHQWSWIVSIYSIGGALSLVLFGWISEKNGRKWSIHLIGIPLIVSWILLACGTNAIYLYVSRFLVGCSGGALLFLLPIYIAEISDNRIRGLLLTMPSVVMNIGVLIGFIGGEFLDYYTFPVIGIFFSTVFICLFGFFPETPQFLSTHNRDQSAIKSFRFYKGNNDGDPAQEESFLSEFKSYQKNVENEKINLSDFYSRYTIKPLLYSFILYQLSALCGMCVMINFTAKIFTEAGTTLSPNICAIIIGVITLTSSLCIFVLIEKFGRKILVLISSFGCGICYILLGIYFFLKHIGKDVSVINWLPLFSLSGVMCMATFGITSVALVITIEILPPKLRSFLTCVLSFLLNISTFLLTKYFSYMVEMIDMHNCVWFFAFCCFVETIFVMFCIKETKGKSYEAISKELCGDINIKKVRQCLNESVI